MKDQRQIKFRVWDKVTGRFWYFDFTNFLDMIDNNFEDGEIAQMDFYQYTGLKDKNSKEIYEGDIVKIHCSNPYGTAVIEYSAPEFLLSVEKGACSEYCYDEWEQYFDVIGNIYENPELMKENK